MLPSEKLPICSGCTEELVEYFGVGGASDVKGETINSRSSPGSEVLALAQSVIPVLLVYFIEGIARECVSQGFHVRMQNCCMGRWVEANTPTVTRPLCIHKVGELS